MIHQFIERNSNMVMTEELFADRIVIFLYSTAREHAPKLLELLTSARMSSLLGFCNFDLPLAAVLMGNKHFLARCGVDLNECLESPDWFTSPRKVFERKIKYWHCRPMVEDLDTIVSPADSRILVGSLSAKSELFLKDKFFNYKELLGDRQEGKWLKPFAKGDYAIFRLTPDKYHYNHLPVSGIIVDFYEISGCYHSCNPGAVVEVVTPYSKNKRLVTLIQTDVPGGSQVGLVAMIEVVALMIGEVVQCYSDKGYDVPLKISPGMFVRKGQPKSLYRPGSSTDVLLFQQNRVRMADDLLCHMSRSDVESRFSAGFGKTLVETDVQVRSPIAYRV